MSDQIITLLEYLPTILFVVILVFYFLRGMMRGLSKSIKLFVTFLISLAVAAAFYITISNIGYDTLLVTYGNTVLGWFGSSWDTIFGLSDSGNTTMTQYLEEYISNSDLLQTYAAEFSVTTLAAIIYSLSCVVLNLILFIFAVIVFFISKFILYILYLIFLKEKRRKHRIEKAYKDGKRESGYHKHALAGGLVGLIRGLLVGIFVVSIFGTISYVVSYDDTTSTSETTTDSTYADMYEIINYYGTSGIVKILNSVQNDDGLPYYLIISKELMETDYTYTNSDGEDVTVTLSLSDDLAPLSSSLCKTAYYFLLYGFDTSQASDTTYLTEFITSDTEIDGYTLEERIETVLDGVGLGSYFAGVLDSFATAYVDSLTDGITDSDDSFSDLPLTTKILYHLFVGDNALSTSELLEDGNMEIMFSTFCDVLKNMDTINTVTSIYSSDESSETSTISSETLAFGISSSLTDEEVDDGENVADLVKDDLSGLSFYEDDSFDLVMTDIVKDIIGTYMPDFDFTSTNDEYIYDIDWSSSIDSVFDLLSDVIDTVVDNDIADTTALYDYYFSQLEDSSSEVYTILDNALETSACCILLNTVGFSDFLETNINSSISSIFSGMEITLPDVSYGSYTDSDGNYVEGQLKIIIDTVGTSLSDIYDIMSNPDTTSEDSEFYNLSGTDLQAAQISALVDILCASNSDFRDLLDSDSSSYSILMQSILSDVITSSSVTYSDTTMSFYLPSSAEETITINSSTTKEVLSSDEFSSLFDFMYSISGDISDIMGGDIDYVGLIYDNSDYIKASQFVLANMSKYLYTYSDTLNLVIPTSLDLSDENIDTNISSWIDDDAEMSKMIDAIVDNNDLLASIVSGENYNSYLVDIVVLKDAKIEELAASDVINATITSKLTSLDTDDITIYIPDAAYSNDEETTLESSELVGLLNYIEALFDVTSDTDTIDFNSIEYSNITSENAINALSDSSIMVATIANYFVDNMATTSTISDYIDIPDSLVENLDTSTTSNIINDYDASPWKDELVTMLSNLDLLGVTFTSDNSASMDLSAIFYLGDINDDDSSKTNAEVLCESEILQASVTKTLESDDCEEIFIPDEALDDDGYITADDLGDASSSLKSLVNSDYYSDGLSSLSGVISAIDMSSYSNDISSLFELVDPIIVNATIAKNIVDSISDLAEESSSPALYLPENLEFSSSSQTNLEEYWFDTTDDSDDGETKLFLQAINEFGLLDSVTSSSQSIGSGMSVDSLLDSDVSISTVIESQTMWYTFSQQILSQSNLTVTSDVVSVNSNSEIYVVKDEITAFYAGMSAINSGSISDVTASGLDASTIYDEQDTIFDSSIIRNLVSSCIASNGYEIVTYSSIEDETFVNENTKYDTSGATTTTVLSLKETELQYFLAALYSMNGDSSTDLSFDASTYTYNSDLSNLDAKVFDSSVLLNYFQSALALMNVTTTYDCTINYWDDTDILMTESDTLSTYTSYISKADAQSYINGLNS